MKFLNRLKNTFEIDWKIHVQTYIFVREINEIDML